VKELHQYDLQELGFTLLEEKPSPDVSKSLREGWVKGAFDWLSVQVGEERGIQQKQVSRFYKNLVKKIDANGDGELSGKELYNALHHPELGLRDIAARLIVRHDSEWFGGSSHHRWSVFFQNYDRLRMAYAKQWLDDCEWVSQVDAFKSGEPVWHMHPVIFCSAIKDSDQYEITVEMIEELLGHKNPWFTGKSGGKVFAEKFQTNYPNVFEFDKKKFVHILNKIMTTYGITGPYHKAHFLSQCLHESAHLDTTLEFGSGRDYDPGRHADAEKYENTVVGDGPKYRGRGLIQLTWKKNYRLFSQYSGGNFVSDPELIAANMENTIKASTWFWRNNGGIFKKFDANGEKQCKTNN
jgi:predicted chitinase